MKINRDNTAITLVILAPIWWVTWNIYFGWNEKALSPFEGFTDMMFWVILLASFVIKPASIQINHTFNGNPKVTIVSKEAK